MKRLNARAVFPVITLLLGLLWLSLGLTQYGWWISGRAQSGFFPSLVGGFLIFVSILAIIAEIREEKAHFIVGYLHPVLAAVGMVVLALLIGFFPALVIYLFGWLKWYEKYDLRIAGITTVITAAFMYGVFHMWLRVPFPTGILIELL